MADAPYTRYRVRLTAFHGVRLTAYHGQRNGLPRISRGPAPIQVNYKNWVASSGIPALTHNIGDRIVCPPELQADYTEAQVLVANSNPKP